MLGKRNLVVLLFVMFMATGCDRSNSSPDIVKIVPDEHKIIKDFAESNGENVLNQGVINLKAGNIQQAISILQQYVQYHPGNSVAHLYLGKAYYEDNQTSKALFHIKQAFSLDSTLSRELAGPFIGKGVIGRVFVTNETDEGKKLALKPKACFDKDTPVIYASIEIINALPDTEIESEWVYEISKNEEVQVNSAKFKAEGSKDALVSIKKPDSSWPPGKYKLNVYVNREKNTDLTFYVF